MLCLSMYRLICVQREDFSLKACQFSTFHEYKMSCTDEIKDKGVKGTITLYSSNDQRINSLPSRLTLC